MTIAPTRIKTWLIQDLWKTRARDLPQPRRTFVKLLKIALLAGRTFKNDQATVRAAALTLYTLLSIVPVTALLFGIAKGFGLDAKLEAWLMTQFAEQQDVMKQTVIMARRALQSTQGGLVAGAGVAFLIYSVVKVVGNIEEAFNRIWSIAKARTWSRQFSDYLSLILVGPFFILGASSINVYVKTLISQAAKVTPLSIILNPATRIGLMAAPILILWLLFAFLYVFLPNTKVRIGSAVFGGAVAAILYQVIQSLYIDLQVGVSRNNAIYGSFAALPLFLIWLNLSWRIVLLGAEVTHQHQNFESNEREERIPELSFRAIKRLTLGICDHVSGKFLAGEMPPTAEAIGTDLGIPTTVLASILEKLVKARLLAEVVTDDPVDPGYHPARDPRSLTPSAIVEALEAQGEDLAESADKAEGDRYDELLAEFDRYLASHPANKPLGLGERR